MELKLNCERCGSCFLAGRDDCAIIAENGQLKAEVDRLMAEISELEAAHTRPGCVEHQLEELRDAVKKMLHIDTPENFEGGSYLAARAEVEGLLAPTIPAA